MKLARFTAAISLSLLALSATAESGNTLVYVNQNLGFNVEGYKYAQAEFPCNIDAVLVQNLIERGKLAGLQLEAVSTADKIRNGVIPVLAIDIEQLVLGQNFTFGTKAASNLPRVQVTAALITGRGEEGFVSAKHSCAIASLNQFTPSSDITDMGTAATVCSATRKCLRDLSKDIVQWIEPQVR